MSKTVIAFIGCGSMAGAHCRSLKILWEAGFHDFEVAALCDLVEGRAFSMADEFAAFTGKKPAVYTDAADMLAKEKSIQSVLVITPHISHHTLAIAAMEAGCSVIVEKPVGITVRAAKKMIETSEKTGRLLHVAENYRMDINERAIHWAVTSGLIGSPRILNWTDVGERKWYWDWRDHVEIAGGAWTLDGGVHHSDLFQYNLGPVRRVSAASRTYDATRYQKYESMDDYNKAILEKRYAHMRKTRSLKEIDPATLEEPIAATVEDTTAAVLEFESGAVGTWLVSRAAPGRVDRSNVIYGSEGALFWNDGLYNAKQEQVYTSKELQEAFKATLSKDECERLFPLGVYDSLAIEWKQHFDAVSRKIPVEVDAQTGLNAMVVPMAIYESAETGRAILIKDMLDLKEETYQKKFNDLIGL